MSLVKRRPDVLSAFPSFFKEFGWDSDFMNNLWPAANFPAVNIFEDEVNYHIEMAAPGKKKEDFRVTADDGILTIKSEMEDKVEKEEKEFHRVEYNYESFERSFRLPKNIDHSKIKANYEDGLLKIAMKKIKDKKLETKSEIKVS